MLVLGALTLPATAGAAFTGQVHSQTRVQLSGTDAAEHLQISLDGGLFRHDRIDGAAGTDAVQGSGGDDIVLGERPVGGAGNDVMTMEAGSSGIVRVPVTCSQGARGGCLGSVVLVTADPVSIGTAKVPVHLGREPFKLAPGASAEVEVFVADGEELARAAGGRLLQVQAQVVGDLAEHTTKLPLNILK